MFYCFSIPVAFVVTQLDVLVALWTVDVLMVDETIILSLVHVILPEIKDGAATRTLHYVFFVILDIVVRMPCR